MPETAAAPSDSASSAASSTANADYGKEFSKPVGKADGEVWQKYFGKDAVSQHETERKAADKSKNDGAKKPEPKAKADGKAEAKPEPKKPADDKRESKKADAKAEPKPETKAEPKKADAEKKPDAKATPKSEPADAAEDTADDGAAPTTARARKLFEQAEASEDPGEARKLYKRAMREAFGKVPDAFDDGKYGLIRQERKRASADLAAVAKKNEDRIQEAVRILTPASTVMRKLQDSGLGEKLTMPLIERAIETMRALRSLEDGDFTALSEVVARASGKPHDEAMKLFVRGVKMSPDGRAARLAAEQAQREAQETRQQLQALQRQLNERDEAAKVQQTEAERQAQVTARREEYLESIETELAGHPVLQLPRGKERVLAYLIKTADKTLKAPKYSFEQAADRIVAHEKRRRAETAHLDGGETETAPAEQTGTRLRTVGRSEQRDGGVRDESADAAFDRIFKKHSAGGRRR